MSRARLGTADRHGFPEMAPDLAVEVLSPSDRLPAVQRKVGQYLGHGGRSVWVLDPRRRRMEQHLAGGVTRAYESDGDIVEEPALPGFRCTLGDLLPRPLGPE